MRLEVVWLYYVNSGAFPLPPAKSLAQVGNTAWRKHGSNKRRSHMRSKFVLLYVALAFVFFAGDAFTCGDKFLVGWSRHPLWTCLCCRSSCVNPYLPNDAKFSKDLESTLKKSGHKIQTVADQANLFTNCEIDQVRSCAGESIRCRCFRSQDHGHILQTSRSASYL